MFACLWVWNQGAQAEWTGAVRASDGEYSTYVDLQTVTRVKNLVTVWSLTDYSKLQTIPEGGYRSVKAFREFDCEKMTQRISNMTYYSEGMAQGKILLASSESSIWAPPPPAGSIAYLMLKYACEGAWEKSEAPKR